MGQGGCLWAFIDGELEVRLMSLLDVLCQLQAVDREWGEKARLYRSVEGRLSDGSELKAKREAQQRRAEGLAAEWVELRDAELELSGLQAKAQKVETDLYGGRIRAPRELENLRRDSEYLQRRVSEVEDRVLIGLTGVDELEAAARSGEEELSSFEAASADEHESLTVQYKELRSRLRKLQSAREELRRALGRAELALYDELRNKKRGTSLSPVRNGVCQMCRVTVPSYKAELTQAGDTVVTCEGCGRILYPG